MTKAFFVAGLLCLSCQIQALELPFDAGLSIASGTTFYTEGHAADLDLDGDQDFVYADNGNDVLYWLENDSHGNFTAQNITSGSTNISGINSIQTVDMDLDGDIDILVADRYVDHVVWFENNGDASVWTKNTLGSGVNYDSALSAITGDIDQDGDPDVIAGVFGVTTLYLLTNNGGAASWTESTLSATFSAFSLDLADYDGDTDLDLLIGTSSGSILYMENASGSFAAAETISATGGTITAVKFADINSDGLPEILTSQTGGEIKIWQKVIGSWQSENITGSNGGYSIQAIDLDQDGDLDIVPGDSTPIAAWYENTLADGSSWTQHILETYASNAVNTAHAFDSDGDGDYDLIYADRPDTELKLYQNRQIHRSAMAGVLSGESFNQADHIVSADIALDGRPDLIVANTTFSSIEITHYINDPSGLIADPVYSTSGTGSLQDMDVGDIDADGDQDIVIVEGGAMQIAWISSNYNSVKKGAVSWTYEDVIDTLSSNGSSDVLIRDINHDGQQDVVASVLAEDRISWYHNNLDGSWRQSDIDSSINSASSIQTGDIDGNGSLDVVAVSNSAHDLAWWSNDLGDASTWTLTKIDDSINNPKFARLGDMDGDGDLDLVAVESSQGDLNWYANNGDGSSWTGQTISSNIALPSDLLVMDADADGDLDVIVNHNFTDSSPDAMLAFINDGTANSWISATVDHSLDTLGEVVSNDFDQDGQLDLAYTSYGDDVFVIKPSLGGHVRFSTTAEAGGTAEEGQATAVFSIEASHLGQALDDDILTAMIVLQFEYASSCGGGVIPTVDHNQYFDRMSLFLDDGDTIFNAAADTLLTSTTQNSVIPIEGAVGLMVEPNNTDALIAPESLSRLFAIVVPATNASSEACTEFVVNHITETDSIGAIGLTGKTASFARHGTHATPLLTEYAANTQSSIFTIVPVSNHPPTLVSNIPSQTLDSSDSLSLDISSYFTDPDGDSLSFTMGSESNSFEISSLGLITGTANSRDYFSSPVVMIITATDPGGLSVNASLQLNITDSTQEWLFSSSFE